MIGVTRQGDWLRLYMHNGTERVVNINSIEMIEPCPDPSKGSILHGVGKAFAVSATMDQLAEAGVGPGSADRGGADLDDDEGLPEWLKEVRDR